MSHTNDIVHTVITTDRMHRKAVDKYTANLGIHRGQLMMLTMLCRNGAPLSQREIAERLDISPTAVAVKIKKLESDGLIERSRLDCDSRTNSVNITDKGREKVEKAHSIFQLVDDAMIKGISDEQKDSLLTAFEIMRSNLSSLIGTEESEGGN